MADSGEHRAVRERFSDTGEELMAVLRRQHVSHNTLIRVEAYLGAIMREHKAALAAQPSAEPGLDVERLALAAYLDRPPLGNRPVPWPPSKRRDWTAWARRMAAALPDRPTPGAGGETGLQCLCGTDAALAAGETIYARLDIVCPKHDQGFGRL